MSNQTTDERANAVPLIEQLRSVPLNAHHFVEINPTHHRNIPYGPWCHAAADEIEQLRELLSIAQDRNAEHCAEVQRLRDICHRLNAAYGGADDVPANHVCSFSYTGGQQQDRCVVCGAHPRG